jgi:hypothetical protein
MVILPTLSVFSSVFHHDRVARLMIGHDALLFGA